MERQFSPKGSAGNTGNFKQFQGATNNGSHSYPHYSTNSQKPHYQSNLNTKEQKLQKRDSGQRSNNKGNVDSLRNQKKTDRNGNS